VVVTATAIAGLSKVAVKFTYYDAPGRMAQFNLLENFKSYLTFWTYHLLESTYGIIGPSGVFVGTLAVIVIILFRGWPGCPLDVRRYLLIAAGINFPLFFVFCAAGELRNLSLLFVGFVILIAIAVERQTTLARR
jgi:hypothetical protein